MKITTTLVALAAVLMTLSACANTIRGAGADTANAVNATQSAGEQVNQAATTPPRTTKKPRRMTTY
ncbi:entericidin [Phyllobacterium salinisoli]|uniref:Entericidin n=1 Tax=Phyllobacterium salinisoli TaxID=1899321 RepID=A0A368K184_9HYPH|nr:entericidin [Phyllobacterium salinisoli]